MTRKSNYKKVTMIDDLPDLKDIEESIPSHIPNPQKYEKFLMDKHRPSAQAGMGYGSMHENPAMSSLHSAPPLATFAEHEMMASSSMPDPNLFPPNVPKPPNLYDNNNIIEQNAPYDFKENFVHPFETHSNQKQENFINKPIIERHTSDDLNCIDIANHIESCPICSKFYKNNNTIFVIIIFILSIFCLILLKKVLDICNN